MKHTISALCLVLLFLWHSPAEAVRSFTIAQSPASVEFVMASTNQAVTYIVTNNSNAGETITSVRFRLAATTYTNFPTPEIFVVPDPNWNCTRNSSSRVTCSTTVAASYITPGNSKNFGFRISSTATTWDRIDQLGISGTTYTSVRSGGNWYGNPTLTRSGSWTWKALSMTLVSSSYSVAKNCKFTLTMTITNKSTTSPLTITSIPKPPTATTTGGASASTLDVPSNLSLNANATGTMVWTYTTGGTAGTVTFTACAGTGATCTTTSGSTRTSSSVTTPVITVTNASCLTAAIAVTPSCLYSGDTATFVMTVTNGTGSTVNNVTPSALTKFTTGAAAIGAFTGPAPASIGSLGIGSIGTFTWTAAVTGNVSDTYYVTGYATATGPITGSTGTSNTEDVDGYTVAVNPSTACTNSTNEELTWTVTNYGCGNIKQVTIPTPGGWTATTDGYALVWRKLDGTQVDNWTWTLGTTTFTPPTTDDYIPPPPAAQTTGEFSLVFSQMPLTTGPSTFTAAITDDQATPHTENVNTTVTVNDSVSDPAACGNAPGQGKYTLPETWRESY